MVFGIMFGMPTSVLIVSLVFMGLSMLVGAVLKARFAKYSKVALSKGLSGKEVAERMLRESGITDVQVLPSQGFLSDHYNPANKTVNLSPEVYNGVTVSAAAVASHECGHAVQHATAYKWLQFRSKMVPATMISSNLSQWLLMIGAGGMFVSNGNPTILLIGIGLLAITTLFTVITLPVEFDASRRALAWLDKTGMTTGEEHTKAKDALKWAATTYVVAALSSIVMLVQYILIYLNSRDRS
jgi:uncharacterized protein